MPWSFRAWITLSFPPPEGAESTNRSPCLVDGCAVIFCSGTVILVSSGIFSSCSNSEKPTHNNMLTGCRSMSVGCGDLARHGPGKTLVPDIVQHSFALPQSEQPSM